MEEENPEGLSWKFIAYKQGVQIASLECPDDAVGTVIKDIFISQQRGISTPNMAISVLLQSVIDKNILTLETISKLTEIEERYLARLLEGVFEPTDIRKLIHLTDIIEKLR
ncbi:MAG: hypothetical protein LBC21_02685 [Oscillospiraceae bacterium]|jgi:hypothetical protein|nr:hypothetical protein [Oscillospiraceae bacterium]